MDIWGLIVFRFVENDPILLQGNGLLIIATIKWIAIDYNRQT